MYKSNIITMRASDAQKKQIQSHAATAGMSVSEYMIMRGLKGVVVVDETVVVKEGE